VAAPLVAGDRRACRAGGAAAGRRGLGDISFVMATPLATFRALSQPHCNWLQHTLATAAEVLTGLGMAILFSWSSVLDRFRMPLIVTLNMIPKIPCRPCSSSGCRSGSCPTW
jgi:ABC-type nitrate/sulfonate/bicarbonate transport system permease component